MSGYFNSLRADSLAALGLTVPRYREMARAVSDTAAFLRRNVYMTRTQRGTPSHE